MARLILVMSVLTVVRGKPSYLSYQSDETRRENVTASRYTGLTGDDLPGWRQTESVLPSPSPRRGDSSAPIPLPRLLEAERDTASDRGFSADEVILSVGDHTITSPNYPHRYPNNALTSTTYRAAHGQLLEIECPFVDIEAPCSLDYLSINGMVFCGHGSIAPINAVSLEILFSSDGSVRRRGYSCTISVPEGSMSTVSSTEATTSTAPPPPPSGGQCCGLARRSTRIVGGVETEVREYPWQAGLVDAGDTWIWCGGSVINDRYVLTAAHCTAGRTADQIEVLLGEHTMFTADGERRYTVTEVTDHPKYRSADRTGYDFSLLRLAERLDFTALGGEVAPACLPTGGEFIDVDAIVSGWGTTSSGGSQPDVLHEVTVRTQSNTQCSAAYSRINESMLCAAAASGGGKDACQGDSGGPLVTEVSGRYTLIGVVSWGIGCALPEYPGVYGRVTVATDWIQLNTPGASLC